MNDDLLHQASGRSSISVKIRKLLSKGEKRGVALIITLAFIILLTALVVAFFSRSITALQISNGSANRVKTDLFADGAVDTILSDLKQEIVANSTNTPIVTGSVTTNIYVPKTAANAVPSISVKQGTQALNILKQSAAAVPIYKNGPVRAILVSSTTPALNGRYIPIDRWNEPLLIPKATGTSTDVTPATTGSNAFVPPDWVLVSRDGSNPATMSAQLGNAAVNPANPKFVVGRYAYNIYDEGGLLDMNAAGYPTPAVSGTQAGYKMGLAFADLTQLPGINQLTPTATRPNEIVTGIAGWRNWNTLQSVPGTTLWYQYTFPATAGVAYMGLATSNLKGYLTAPYNVAFGGQKQTDKMFTSRQELIQMMLQGLIDSTGTPATQQVDRAKLQNALQYMTTFTRDLNQPSFVRTQSINSSLPGYDSTAPKVLTVAKGGNNQATLDAYVNPSFPAVLVQKAFLRADGVTQAAPGEPLVKKRFALSRLAWLTYQGPSALRAQTDPDIQLLINTYGIPLTFLQQGTVANIKAYFGLTWVLDSGSKLGKWSYNVHNGPLGSGSTGAILRLGAQGDTAGIAYLATPHDPDFFELLKASVSAGSKAKASTVNYLTTNPADYQAQSDVSFDYAVMQIGANIIEQSKVDGFAVRIAFDDGTLPAKEFSGVENNPYLYRVRWGSLKVRAESPVMTGNISPVANDVAGKTVPPAGTTTWAASQGLLKDPGVSMVMMLPEIWNPHDQNSPMPSASLRPALFRIVADSAAPSNISATNFSAYNQFSAFGMDTIAGGNPHSDQKAVASGGTVPPFSRAKGGIGAEITGSYKGFLHPLTPADTAITFQVPNATIFREPTLLARANVPAGSNLKIDQTNWSKTNAPDIDYAKLETSTGPSLTANGFTVDAGNPLVLPNPNSVAPGTEYVGTPIGLFPSEWVGPRVAFQTPSSITNIYRSDLCGPNGANLTYRLQYQDPTNAANWITYDTKYVTALTSWLHNMLGAKVFGGLMQGVDVWASYTDPRTSRFGAMTPISGSSNTNGLNAPGAAKRAVTNPGYGASETTPADSSEWLDPANDVLITNRPTYDAGFYFTTSGTTQTGGWSTPSTMFPGLLSQNSTSTVDNGQRYSGVFGKDPYPGAIGSASFYTDADGIMRRAMGAYVTNSTTVGLPMAALITGTTQSQSRPWILHRPFRSVAELGYVFSGTPWKNLDFFTPESGDSALLDVFCVQDTSDPNAMIAGKTNLNTRQQPVLNAILAGAYRDEQNPAALAITGSTTVNSIVAALMSRTATSGTAGPLANVSQLVGKWTGSGYDGFSQDLSAVFTGAYGANSATTNIQRFRESVIRPFASAGMTRSWNLMIDVIAQSGRFPASATAPANFVVQGEQRYWVHVAIDRLTGKIIDKQVEVVNE